MTLRSDSIFVAAHLHQRVRIADLNTATNYVQASEIEKTRRNIGSNVLINWSGYLLQLLILFYLSPFIISNLGDTRYGVLMVITSITGYMSIAELGTQAGLGRFLNHYLGKNDSRKFNEVLNCGIAIFLGVGITILLTASLVASNMETLFPSIPKNLITDSKIACLIAAANLWLTLLTSPFHLALQSWERFGLCTITKLSSVLIGSAGMVIALRLKGGLAEVMTAQTLGSLVGLVSCFIFAKRVITSLQFGTHLVRACVLKEIATFSGWAFLATIGYRIVSSTDTILVTTFFGPSWVTIYVVGQMLTQKLADMVNQTISAFRPRVMKACATSQLEEAYRQFYLSCITSISIGTLGFIGILNFGDDFVRLWLGEGYQNANEVILILSLAGLISIPQLNTLAVLSALNYIRLTAFMNLAFAALNILSSLFFILILDMDFASVALGTLTSTFVISIVFIVLTYRLLETNLFLMTQLYSRWLLGGILFYLLGFCVNTLWECSGWIDLTSQILITTILFLPIAWWILLDHSLRKEILERIIRLRTSSQ